MTHRRSNEVMTKPAAAVIGWVSLLAMGLATLPAHAKDEPASRRTHAEQPPPPCHPNPRAALDMETVANRGDIRKLPAPLKERLVQLAGRPHSVLPVQAFAEADQPSQLFQYYLLDTTGFEPNVFTTSIPGVNDAVQLSVTGANCGLPTIGAVRVGSRDRTERRRTRAVRSRRSAVRYGEVVDHPPLVPAALVVDDEQRIDVGEDIDEGLRIVGIGRQTRLRLEDDADGADRRKPAIGPGDRQLHGINNMASVFGDNPNLPRDPDKFDGDVDAQREFRQRGIPSGLANEVLLDVYERPASFEPGVTDLERRLFDAYAAEVARVDQNGDGIISAVEGDIDTASDGFQDNTRLFLPATAFNRFAVTREINDGLLAPRFAPSQRAWILTGTRVPVSLAVPASAGRDADDR